MGQRQVNARGPDLCPHTRAVGVLQTELGHGKDGPRPANGGCSAYAIRLADGWGAEPEE